MTRKTAAEKLNEAYQNGYHAGVAAAREQFARAKPDLYKETLEAKIKLINAVGQSMQTQATLMTGLAQVFDNGPR